MLSQQQYSATVIIVAINDIICLVSLLLSFSSRGPANTQLRAPVDNTHYSTRTTRNNEFQCPLSCFKKLFNLFCCKLFHIRYSARYIYTFIVVLDNLKTVESADVGVARSRRLPLLTSASNVARTAPVRIVPYSLINATVPL